MSRLIAIILALVIPAQAFAVSAGDFLDSMTADERNGFMNGALDMLAYDYSEAGQQDRAACVIQWYFEGNGPREVAAAFDSHRDLPAVAIIKTLASRSCN